MAEQRGHRSPPLAHCDLDEEVPRQPRTFASMRISLFARAAAVCRPRRNATSERDEPTNANSRDE